MTTLINIRSLLRGAPPIRINGVHVLYNADTEVDVDLPAVRRDLHHFMGAWVVTGTPTDQAAETAAETPVVVAPIAIAGGSTGPKEAAGGLAGWTNPQAFSVLVTPVLSVTTIATGAAGVDVGENSTGLSTAATDSLSNQDVHSATGNFVGKPVLVAAGKYITVSAHSSADTTGLVAKLYLSYVAA